MSDDEYEWERAARRRHDRALVRKECLEVTRATQRGLTQEQHRQLCCAVMDLAFFRAFFGPPRRA